MTEFTLSTVYAKIQDDNTGHSTQLPVLLSRDGVSRPMVTYQRLFQSKSLTWQKKLCLAVRLLCEYAAANAAAFATTRDLFATFSVRLRTGTFGPDGLDPSGLYWLPRTPKNADDLIRHLTGLSAWMEKNYKVESLNPLRDATKHEQVIAATAWAHRNNASFLGHAESRAKARAKWSETPWAPRHGMPDAAGEKRPRYPEDQFLPLLFDGFALNKNIADRFLRLDLRCALITLLQHGGGLRMSECFHLWTEDVRADPLDPSTALVRIGEPDLGLVEWRDENAKTVTGSRREFLSRNGLQPRNMVTGKRHAGWKNPTLDGKWYLQVYWSDPAYGVLFFRLWRLYLQQLICVHPSHPWAFVNLTHARGELFTLASYARAHERAVRRIGLTPRKSLGTTPHGHRHAYMYRLAEAGLRTEVIKRAAHHHCVESQLAYTAPESATIRNEIDAAYRALDRCKQLNTDQAHES